jgi:hypothetical protein
LKSSVSASLEKVDDEWVKKPITISETLSLFDDLSVRQTFVFDPEESQLTSSSSSLSYDWASVAYEMKYTRGYDFIDPATGWKRRDEDELQATAASVRLRPFWRNRVTLKAGADANWRLNLLRFTDSTFTFGSNLTVGIYDFLDLTFSSQSRNASTFIYVRPWAEGVGLEPRNVFADLLKSVNFFDREDREDSYFNVQRLSVKATHYLGDWNLNVEYSGRPEQVTDDLGRRSYEWNRELSILLQWRPIPELKSSISVDREEGILFGE